MISLEIQFVVMLHPQPCTADYYGHQENIKIIMDRLNDYSPVGGFSRKPLFYVLNGLEEIYEERYSL